MTDERLALVREEVETGNVSPRSLVLLFNAAADAGHDGDVVTLTQTLELARAIASREVSFRTDAERLVTICEQTLSTLTDSAGSRVADAIVCPDCGSEVAASAVRCRRCGHLFL